MSTGNRTPCFKRKRNSNFFFSHLIGMEVETQAELFSLCINLKIFHLLGFSLSNLMEEGLAPRPL